MRHDADIRPRPTPRNARRASLIAAIGLLLFAPPAIGARLKDIAAVKGVRANQVIGYGLVVGLKGTGDKQNTQFTTQSLRSLLAKMGISIDPSNIRVANVPAVMVTASLPPFVRAGSTIDANHTRGSGAGTFG